MKDYKTPFKFDGENLKQGDVIFNKSMAGIRINELQKIISGLRDERDRYRAAYNEHAHKLEILLDAINFALGNHLHVNINRKLREAIEKVDDTFKTGVKRNDQ